MSQPNRTGEPGSETPSHSQLEMTPATPTRITPEKPPGTPLQAPPQTSCQTIPEPLDVAQVAGLIHTGQMTVRQLTVDQRRQCVADLTDQGYSARDIARLLGMEERCVRRDRADFRRAQAQPPDLRLGDEMLGEYQRLALASIQRLIRMAHDPQLPPALRLRAETAITQTYHRLLETAHRLKYLSDGQSRLIDQRDNDPVQLNACLEDLKAEIRTIGHRRLELLGASDDPDDLQREQQSVRECW